LPKCIHQEDASMLKEYVFTHEHDFGLSHMYMDINNQLLTCSLRDVSYCERCGKEISTSTS
jgi:predicted Zn-dependent protease